MAAAAAGIVIGVATVLIPNSLFARDVPTEWWDYPVWVLMSALLGILVATYLREPRERASGVREGAEAWASGGVGGEGTAARSQKSGFMGSLGGVLGWFAVGCPVCNKIALLILGYTGALTYFAPLQPILAVLSVVLLLVAVVVRLKGQYVCPLPSREETARS